MPSFNHDGFSLYYDVHGAGRPVVMLHGITVTFDGNFRRWGWVECLNAKGLRVIGLDFRGHGGSSKSADPSRYGTEKLAGDVVCLLDALGIEKASLIGYSLGSAVALHLLHTRADRCDRSALVGTGDGLIGLSPFTMGEVIPQLREAVSRSARPTDLPDHVSAYWTFATNVSGDRASAVAAASADYPCCTAAELRRVQAHVLVVSGDADPVLGRGPRLAEMLHNGKYLEVSGADHFSLAADPRTRKAVSEFLAVEE